MALRNTLDQEDVETSGERASRLFAGSTGAARGRATTVSRSSPTLTTPQESIIEIYRGGARTLISYN